MKFNPFVLMVGYLILYVAHKYVGNVAAAIQSALP